MATEPTFFDLEGSEGVNESERILTKLCRKSFLRLWAQSNIYTDEGFKNGRGSAKELCDALVVFGNDVLVFSDKHILFQADKPLDVAWPRWYRRAVVESIRQLNGARNWLERFPARAYLDAGCTRKLPVPVPTGPAVKYHLIAVTRGSREATLAAQNGEGLGSFQVNTGIQGDAHLQTPFAIGNPVPKKKFVHVFDEVTVELLMDELDTAADFIYYLNERELLLGREGSTVIAEGEEDLLALYLQTMDASGEKHKFFDLPDDHPGPDMVYVDSACYQALKEKAAYQRKKEADKISYEWDRLVNRFIELGDPTLNVGLLEQDLKDIEQGLRLLAAESRFRRRQLADSFIGALRLAPPGRRMARVVNSQVPTESVFVFLVVPKKNSETYYEYRRDRLALLHAYCRVAKLQARQANVFVGIAFDNPHNAQGGGSEDLFVYEQDIWSEDDIRELEKMRDELNILGSNVQLTRYQHTEFPAPAARVASPREVQARMDVQRSQGRKKDKETQRKKMKQQSKRRNRR